MATNLLSVNQLTKDNKCKVTFDGDSFVVQDKSTNQVLQHGSNVHGLYQFTFSSPQAFISTTGPRFSTAQQWHQRLGHPSSIKLQQLLSKLNIPSETVSLSLDCTHCCIAKSHRLPFKLSNSTVNQPLSLVHSDVWGPFHKSNSQYKYYVLFVDDFSRFTWVYPLHYKSEVFDKFLEFKVYVGKQFSVSLQILRTDGGTEFINNRM